MNVEAKNYVHKHQTERGHSLLRVSIFLLHYIEIMPYHAEFPDPA